MTLTIVPFGDAHIEPAAVLLAARHRRDRAWTPDLAPQFEDLAATGPVLQELGAQDGMDGVAALRDGRLEEIARVLRLIDEGARLVTLTGSGGREDPAGTGGSLSSGGLAFRASPWGSAV